MVDLATIHLIPTLLVFAGMLPVYVAVTRPGGDIGWLTDIAFVVGLAAAILELVADVQMHRFVRDRRDDQAMDRGLWSWSRHPNYFFEWFGWLAYPLLAIDFSGVYPWGFAALLGPACMYWLLVYVSGIPPLEAHMLERRRDEFRAYQARTSAFFPVPSRAFQGSK